MDTEQLPGEADKNDYMVHFVVFVPDAGINIVSRTRQGSDETLQWNYDIWFDMKLGSSSRIGIYSSNNTS